MENPSFESNYYQGGLPCHLTHAGIECVLRLKESLRLADLSSLTLTVHPSVLDVCAIEDPLTGLEGKFSLKAALALALTGNDTADPRTFEDGVIRGEALRMVMNKVIVETDESLSIMQARVVWVDRGQNSHRAFHDSGIPESDLEVQQKNLEVKFARLCELAGVDAVQYKQAVYSLTR